MLIDYILFIIPNPMFGLLEYPLHNVISIHMFQKQINSKGNIIETIKIKIMFKVFI